MPQAFFHLAFVTLFLTFFAIRAYYYRRAMRSAGRIEYIEGRAFHLVRLVLGIPFALLFLAFVARPSILAWAMIPLPDWAKWLGVALGLASIILIWRVQVALGSNFATTLHLREHHTLVTHGPYRWVRHPMYAMFYLYSLAIFLLTENWLVAGLHLLGISAVLLARLRREEAVMLERFGDDYRRYMQRTGRFWPHLRLPAIGRTTDHASSR
jgi:protein-S-isoprenylcysteine O-methyltransferase Ste14